MAKYELIRDGVNSIIVSEDSINFDTNLGFVGQSKTDYGQQIALNFLLLLENFASTGGATPTRPLRGQLWFDVDNTTLMFNKTVADGDLSSNWVPVGTPIDLNSVLDGMLDGNEVFDTTLFDVFDNVALVAGDDLFNVLEDFDAAISLAAGGGATIFTDLTDTPSGYTGQNGKILQVSGSSIVFVDPAVPPTGVSELNDLSDVNAPSPSQDEVLTWVTGTPSKWMPVIPVASQTELVEDLTPQLGGALEIDGKIIKNTTSGNIVIDNQVTGGLVIIQAESTGFIILDGRRWPNDAPSAGTTGYHLTTDAAGILSWVDSSFLELSDTPSTYLGQNGKFLTVNESTGEIEFSTGTAVPSDLGDLGDVVLESTPANNEVLAFNIGNGKWINQTASEVGLITTGDLSGLQAEVDNIESSLGPFVTSSGTFSAAALNALGNITGLTGSSNLVDVLTQLDAAITGASTGTTITKTVDGTKTRFHWTSVVNGGAADNTFSIVMGKNNVGPVQTLSVPFGTLDFDNVPFAMFTTYNSGAATANDRQEALIVGMSSFGFSMRNNNTESAHDIFWIALGEGIA